MAEPKDFRGYSRWVTAPSLYGGVLGALLATLYAYLTIALAPGSGGWFVFIALAGIGLCTARGWFQEQQSLQALRKLARSSGDGELHRKALRELFAFADRGFGIHLQNWLLGAIGIGLAYRLVPGVTWNTCGRICFIGAVLSPLASTVIYLVGIPRCRRAMARVAEAGKVSSAEVLRLCPPTRLQLRRRLMLFTAVAVLTPTVLVGDFALQRAERALQRVLQTQKGPAQLAAVTETGFDGLAPAAALTSLIALVAIVTGYLAGSALGDPLRDISDEARRIASGDLRAVRTVFAEDEVWAASAAFASMQVQLVAALGQLKKAGLKISSTTEQLLASSSQHESGATAQATALTETSATTEELARSARQISGNAAQVALMAEQTLTAAQGGMKAAEAFYVAMGKTRQGNQAIADSVVKLNKRVQQIGKIVEFISGIADKTDLLAVNAELEGTKAGEVGRGFSLVAAEMRRLAESVIQSTAEIARLIEEIRDATNAAVMATEAGVKATDRGSALSAKVTENLRSILEEARQTSDAVRSISLATHQQQTGTDQLAEAMADILRGTQQGAAATTEVARANADLSTLARELKGAVDRFEVGS